MVDPITAVVSAIGASIGGATGATMIMYAGQIAAATAFTATLAASSALQRRARAKARAAYNASLQDREVTIRSAVSPRRVIYGRDRVAGTLVYAQTTGDKGQYLHLVLALAAHECDAIEQIWFNDTLLPEPDAGGFITSGPFAVDMPVTRRLDAATTSSEGVITLPEPASRVIDVSRSATESVDAATFTGTHTPGGTTISGLPPSATLSVTYEVAPVQTRVRVRKHLGAPGQVADAELVAESGGTWTAACKGTGICYLYVRLEYDQDIFGQLGIPNITAVVRGRKVRDPRAGVTAWSDNAALITADWLRDSTFGLRAGAAEVPDSEVIAAANICDEAVVVGPAGATQKRYIFNGSFTSDTAPREVLEDLLTGMAGACVWTQGRWLIRPGAYRTPVAGAEITEDDLAGAGVVIQANSSRSELFNAVRATYRDPAQAWAEVQAPLVKNALYQAQDGGTQVVRNIQLPGAMDAIRAQRMAKIELERARQAIRLQFTTNLRAYDLAPTDTALVMLQRYGWGAGKVFEITERTWSADGLLQYGAREVASTMFDWAAGEETATDPAPDTDLESPYQRPAAPTPVTVQSGTAHLWKQSDGTIISRALVQWAASTWQFVIQGGRVEVQWVPAGSADWQSLPALPGDAASAYIQPVQDGQAITVRVRMRNALGVVGPWAYATHVVVGKTAAPVAVAGLSATAQPGGVLVAWTANTTDVDYLETEVRQGASWAAGVVLYRGRASNFVWSWPSPGAYTLRARHRDTSGNESASDTTLAVSVGQSSLIGTGLLFGVAPAVPEIYFSQSVIWPASASRSITLAADGTGVYINGSIIRNFVWHLGGAPAATYYVELTVRSGPAPVVGTVGSPVALTSGVTWTWTRSAIGSDDIAGDLIILDGPGSGAVVLGGGAFGGRLSVISPA